MRKHDSHTSAGWVGSWSCVLNSVSIYRRRAWINGGNINNYTGHCPLLVHGVSLQEKCTRDYWERLEEAESDARHPFKIHTTVFHFG
jgi:hypothetical protein